MSSAAAILKFVSKFLFSLMIFIFSIFRSLDKIELFHSVFPCFVTFVFGPQLDLVFNFIVTFSAESWSKLHVFWVSYHWILFADPCTRDDLFLC